MLPNQLCSGTPGQSRVITLLVLQIALGTGVMGEDEWMGTLLSSQAPTMVGLAWAKPLPSAAPRSQMGKALNPHIRETCECRMVYRVVHKVPEAPTLCNVIDARVGVTWPGSALLWPQH